MWIKWNDGDVMIRRKSSPKAAEKSEPRGFDDFELQLGDILRGERATLGKSLLDVQRDLRIKASVIAAIEQCDLKAFETKGFVAGYVRSYARYLGMDPDWALDKFRNETKFANISGLSRRAQDEAQSRSTPKDRRPIAGPLDLSVPKYGVSKGAIPDRGSPIVPVGEALLSRVEPGALGSILVLFVLIGALGFGGFTVFKQVQQVTFVPVEQAPEIVAELDPVAAAAEFTPLGSEDTLAAGTFSGPSIETLDRLYRPEALDTPVLTKRDGPIAALNPDRVGALAPEPEVIVQPSDIEVAVAEPEPTVKVLKDDAPEVAVLAVRPAWVQVRSAEGTVLFEKILSPGEQYVPPKTANAPLIRVGESGAVYFSVGGAPYGPVGERGQVTSNIALSAENLTSSYPVANLDADPDLAVAIAVAQATAAVGVTE